MMDINKRTMFDEGLTLIDRFCKANSLRVPQVVSEDSNGWHFVECAYYRPVQINICVARCAGLGAGGPAWSYPGYAIDRTPYGVLAHEIGHHADFHRSERRGPYYGDYSIRVKRDASHDFPLTSYAPNDAEWFAEMFRLFITNPDLLRLMRPRVYSRLRADFVPVVTDPWATVLHDAPGRTKRMAARKIDEAAKWYDPREIPASL